MLGLVTFCVSFASSVFSTATTVTASEFDVSVEVMILGVSLYVLGFAFGKWHLLSPSSPTTEVLKSISDEKHNRAPPLGPPSPSSTAAHVLSSVASCSSQYSRFH